ncbi:BglG family transcription antiterminator [Desnuesiella massiliensis]|uniref:BglG family transcription antiterminator n=1 Tax=Desnuesiella massiliensis TaxID=1650662 RepID=UPI0006E36085|nr:PTS sugar transporter subunit IIA [Desnuesiella massiliensis]
MYTKRQMKILQLILKNTQGITGTKIAEDLEVSVRTIRNDIVAINDSLKKENLTISSSKKFGYFIKSDAIEPLKQLIYSNEEREYSCAAEENRHLRILSKVIFEGKQHCADLAEMLFVSEQTVYKEINKLKKVLKSQYNCSLIKFSSDFVWIDVSEEEIRQLLFKILKNFVLINHYSYLNEMQILLNDNFDIQEFNIINSKIKQHFARQKVTIDDQSLSMIVGAIYIVIIRNRYGFRIQNSYGETVNDEVSLLIRSLMEMGLEIIENDLGCLNSFLWTIKLTSHSTKKDKVSVLVDTIMSEFCREVMNTYNINLKESEQLIDNMKVHIEYMLRRLDNDYQLTNPIINEVKKKYPFSYEIAMLMVHIVYKYKNKYPIDDEISYIAIYIEYFLEKVNTKLKAVIVSSSRLGFTNIIKNWIHNNFYNQVEVVECMPMHLIDDYLKENKIDLMIFTSQIDITLPIPHYVIEGIPDKNDAILVNNMVYKIKISHKYESIIKKMFSNEFINIYDKSYSFDEIIGEMGRQLKRHERIEDDREYVEDVLQREQNYPTAIGSSFMIPHPLTTFALKTTVSVALMKKPIIHNDKEIKMIFLLAIENKIDDDVSSLFQFFKQIALNKEAFNKLAEVSEKDEFLSQLIYLSKNLL